VHFSSNFKLYDTFLNHTNAKRVMQQLLKPTQKLSRYALMAGVCTLTGLSLFSYYAATVYPYSPQPASSYEAKVLGVVSGKEGYKLRFSATTNGGLVFTGNTFCLSEAADYGSCGTYTTIDTSKKDLEFNPQTAGTTANWKENSASSQVTLPKEADILYAELIWGGNYKYLDIDMTDVLDNEVNLTTPTGNFAVKPDSQTAGEITTNGSYVRTANITEILKKSGSGTYTLGSVPGVMIKGNPYNNYAGYTIAIAYKDDTQPARNMSIFVGAEQVGADQFTNTAVVSGFETPPSGTVDGKLFVSAQEGDNMYSGDQMKFGKTKTSLQPLSGPNNKKDNFFASQINEENGELDQSGSFGDKNQNNSGDNATGVRQGWDVTSVDISNQLSNGQKEAYAQGTSTGDSYVINALGMQIEVNSAKPTLNASVVGGKNEVCEGQEATLEIVVKNEGSADSKNTKLYNLTPQGAELKADGILIDGKPSSGTTSVDLGLLKPGESKTVRYTVVVNKNQNGTALIHKSNVDFNYDMTSQTTLSDTISSNEIKLVMGTYCGINRPPIAEDDSEKTKKATPVTISILTNDSDPDNSLSELKITNVTTPSHGKTELKSDGSVVYTPDADFTGKDTFEYTLCDPAGLCDTATVTVIVQGKKPPMANPDKAETKKNTPVTVAVLPNDSSQDSTLNPQTLEVVTQPKNGTVQVVNGKVVYTPKK